MTEESLFSGALERPTPEARRAFLEAACATDSVLLRRLLHLLAAHEKASGILEQGAAGAADTGPELLAAPESGGLEQPGMVLVGRYKLLEPIGEGGMGTVWMAQQTEPVKRLVAIKLIRPGMDSKQVLARFEAERQALALMDHPNIARILDGGETPPAYAGGSPRPYFVMELVKGVPITEFCDQHQLTPRQRLELFVSVCQAVQHAHQKGIIHRDLKPSNVLVSRHDTTPVVKVIDFGVAKALAQELTDKTLFTGIAQMIGTPLYMSPEQAGMSDLDIDTRSDIYSLGVLLYELLTGTTPFDKERLRQVGYDELQRIIREEEPPRPSTRISTLGQAAATVSVQRRSDPRRLSQLFRGELDWIVMKALEKDRNCRYESASAFAADVQRYLHDEPVQACPPSAWYRFRKFARRNTVGLTTVAMVSLALLLGSAVSAWQAVRATKAEGRTLQESAEKEQALEDTLGAERRRAEAATEQARAEKGRADALETWRQTAHYLRIGLAFNEYQANKVRRADSALDDCEPDLRNWEWHYLKRLCRSELSSVPLGVSNIRQAAFSPDGSRVAHGNGIVVRICDPATGKELVHFALKRQVSNYHLAFSPDGKQLATAGSDGQGKAVHVWDTDTGKEVAVLRGQGLGRELWSAAFSPGGKRVAGTDTQGNLFLWNAATGEQQLHVQAHTAANPNEARHTTVAFHPDGAWLATACAEDGVVKIWDAEKGTLLRSLGQGDGFAQVVVSPKGTWVAAGAHARLPDPTVRLWDAKMGQTRQVFRHTRPVTCLAFSPDEKRLAVGSKDTTLTIWDIQTGREVATYRGHANDIATVAFSVDGTRLLSLGGDHLVKVWDATGAPEGLILKEGHGAWHAALSPDGRLVAVAAMDTAVYVWDADTGKQLKKFLKDGDVPMMVAFSPDSVHLAAAMQDATVTGGSVRVWEVKTGKLVHTLPDPAAAPGPLTAAVAFSPDGKRLASGGLDRAVRIWDMATGQLLLRLPGHTRSVTGLGFSRDGQRLVSATGGWEFTFVGEDRGPLKLKPDNERLIPDLKVWDLTTGQEILNLSLKDKSWQGVAISPDGEVVAAAFKDNSVRIFSVAKGKEVRILKGHSQPVKGIAFSPDGKRLVTGGGSDESVKLWDAQTGEEILTLGRAPAIQVQSVGFSADGRRIVAASYEDVRVWDATPLPRK